MASRDGLTLRQAALTAGFAYLLGPVTYAEFSIYPKLVIPGNIAQTVQNIATHRTLFAVAIFCYFIDFLEDVVIAWALYYLLAPANRALSLLTACFRLVYTAVALYAVLHLVAVFRLVTTPDYLSAFAADQLHAQVRLSLDLFRSDWSLGLFIFAIHLVLLGYLIFRSRYMPRWLGILIVLDGLGWLIDSMSPYFYPNAAISFLQITYLGEAVLMLWLLIRGWKLRDNVRLEIRAGE